MRSQKTAGSLSWKIILFQQSIFGICWNIFLRHGVKIRGFLYYIGRIMVIARKICNFMGSILFVEKV
jgi:hypothetical protein